LSKKIGADIFVDSDTQGVPGTPQITETILSKIRECDIFLADMTFVAETAGGKLIPNPNVMGEYGYARSAHGNECILLAMNTAFGPPDKLPFDLRHLRYPETYNLPETTPNAKRREMREAFSLKLESNLAVILDHLRAPGRVRADVVRREAAVALWHKLITERYARGAPGLVTSPRVIVYLVPLMESPPPPIDLQTVRANRALLAPSIDHSIGGEGADSVQWWSHGSTRRVADRPNPECFWSSRLIRPGVVEWVVNLGQRIEGDRDISIYGRTVEGQIVGVSERAARLLKALGFSGEALIGVTFDGMSDVDVIRSRRYIGGGWWRPPSHTCEAVVIPSLDGPIAGHLKPIFDEFWLEGGWEDGSPSFGQGEWRGEVSL
jgi:hypothetical protein